MKAGATMKLYQALTQVTLNDQLAGQATNFHVTLDTAKPLYHDLPTLYHYIDSVLKPGASHKDNNLKYVSDHIFILENFDFDAHEFTRELKTPDAQATFAYNLVQDLNRHLTINLDLLEQEVQLLFAN
ncbi:hypothetical protein FD22_GL001980 [Loigolactobacillus coryniformis subsp. coryniformis KCTC 3167 = DSM 20001]|nr:hypothetical protein FD22_GL001980 [Loigolactobacillus coryniformis subsp. coryniformis KCTC 3167 = DSM 20001]